MGSGKISTFACEVRSRDQKFRFEFPEFSASQPKYLENSWSQVAKHGKIMSKC